MKIGDRVLVLRYSGTTFVQPIPALITNTMIFADGIRNYLTQDDHGVVRTVPTGALCSADLLIHEEPDAADLCR